MEHQVSAQPEDQGKDPPQHMTHKAGQAPSPPPPPSPHLAADTQKQQPVPVAGFSKSGHRRYWRQVSQYRKLCCNLAPFPKSSAAQSHTSGGPLLVPPPPRGILTATPSRPSSLGHRPRPSLLGPPPLFLSPPTPPPIIISSCSSPTNSPRPQPGSQLPAPGATRRRLRSHSPRPPGAAQGRLGGTAPSSASPFQNAGTKWGGPGRNYRPPGAPHGTPAEPGHAFLAARAHWRADPAAANGPGAAPGASGAPQAKGTALNIQPGAAPPVQNPPEGSTQPPSALN